MAIRKSQSGFGLALSLSIRCRGQLRCDLLGPDACDQNHFGSAGLTALQLYPTLRKSQYFSKIAQQRLISFAVNRRRCQGDFEGSIVLAGNGIAPGSGMETDREQAILAALL